MLSSRFAHRRITWINMIFNFAFLSLARSIFSLFLCFYSNRLYCSVIGLCAADEARCSIHTNMCVGLINYVISTLLSLLEYTWLLAYETVNRFNVNWPAQLFIKSHLNDIVAHIAGNVCISNCLQQKRSQRFIGLMQC